MATKNAPHPLYLAALAADNHYVAVCAKHDMTRWSVTHHEEIAEAAAAKVRADQEWEDFLRRQAERMDKTR